MADKMTPQQRHRCMSSIKSIDTKPEMVVRRWLWSEGFRYRLHVKSLPGTPDIVIRKLKTVIFINGCFWHGHISGECFRAPKSNVQFWKTKIQKNRERDARNYEILKSSGWNVLVVWECQLNKKKKNDTLMALSLKLSEILLDLNGVKRYSIGNTNDDTMLVADSMSVYK
ncbi:MAG: very short patch repair endonuclease [Phocaeicola sp.]|nr:very short patch repair endonuclease [Phocaeicola sp.]